MTCLDAADIDDSGTLIIADAVSLLGFLFAGTRAPSPPFPDCGDDTTWDALGCSSFAQCP
jgi:hypothetical protein